MFSTAVGLPEPSASCQSSGTGVTTGEKSIFRRNAPRWRVGPVDRGRNGKAKSLTAALGLDLWKAGRRHRQQVRPAEERV